MPELYPRLFSLLLLILAASQQGFGQNILIGAGNANVCSGFFFDSGGENGNHTAAGTSQQITICSGMPNTALSHVRVSFFELDIDGVLRVFNGPDTNAPERPEITSENNGVNFSVTATAANTSGCLTFVFSSDGVGTGWQASIECVRSCQDIEGTITTSPPSVPPTTGFVDICPGDNVDFSVETLFPENNTNYTQASTTSTYTWNFQDGTTVEGLGLTSVSHTFDEPGGYFVTLDIEDNQGCTNLNRIVQRVRVAPPPVYGRPDNLPESICVGEELSLTVGRDQNNTLAINFDPSAIEFGFNSSQTFTELIYLPDGNGDEYQSPLTFTNFAPGQTLVSASDVIQICATMEHSYLGDLDIYVTCPDGTEVDLHRYIEGDTEVRSQNLGDGDAFTDENDPPDPFGVYCWSTSAARTMRQVIRQTNVPGDARMPEIVYAPEGNFEDFVGCPLNGQWAINIRDNIPIDNGSIGSWFIELNSRLLPDLDTFRVGIDNFEFVPSQNYSFFGGDSVIFNAPNPGPNNITVITTDDYGCVYDTTVTFNVLPPYAPACASCGPLVRLDRLDTAICEGSGFTPNIVLAQQDTLIVFENVVNQDLTNLAAASPGDDEEFTIRVSGFNPAVISDVTARLESVCIDLENIGDIEDLTFTLRGPNGAAISLLREFNGTGSALTNTCFSPAATQNITAAAPPYSGTFQISQGGWTGLNNSPANGDWRLIVTDRDGNDIGSLISWSLGLRYERDIDYSWSPAGGTLSCTDCPNPVITPVGPTEYRVEITTADGCTDEAVVSVQLATLTVNVSENLTEPNCGGEATGAINLDVSGPDGPYIFAWSTGATTEDITGLTAGDYAVSVSNGDGCIQEFSYTLDEPAPLVATLDDVRNAVCFGSSNGGILVTTTGGTPPYAFAWDDPNAQVEEDAGALTAGTYNLLVTDANGCTTTLTATVGQPDPLALDFRSTQVVCRDGSDGTAVVIASGGNGDYSYAWQTGASQDSISGLTAGTYEVTVTDRLGCMITGSVNVQQPVETLVASAVQDEMGCAGAAENQATVFAEGGRPGYTYRWSNGETTATAVRLPSGTASVTVTDSGGCESVFPLAISDLPAVEISLLSVLPSCNNTSDGRMGAVVMGGAGTQEADYTYLWSTGATTVTIENLVGDRTYRVTVTGPAGCTGEQERFLPAPDPVNFDLIMTPVVCTGESNGALQITNLRGPNSDNPIDFALQWGPEAGNSTSATVSNLPAGDYPLTVTDFEGCTVDTVLTITEPPVLGLLVDQRNVGCFGDQDGSVRVTGTGGVGGYAYAWSNGSEQQELSGLAAGTLTVTVTDANGCTAEETIEITQPEPVGLTGSSTAVLCQGDATGTITLTGTGGRPPYLFALAGRGFTRNNVFIGLPAGEYEGIVRDSAGCDFSTQVIVEDGPTFDLTLPDDTEIIFGDSLQLNPQTDGGIDTVIYQWRGSYPGTLSCTECEEPIAKPEFEIDYTLLVIDGNGCTDEERFRVSVRKIREVFVPTGFTPNGDGMNDRLIVHGRPGTIVRRYLVFDRWTNVVYAAENFNVNDTEAGWDGTYKGQDLNGGVYLYKLEIEYEDGSTEVLSGESTLIRQ